MRGSNRGVFAWRRTKLRDGSCPCVLSLGCYLILEPATYETIYSLRTIFWVDDHEGYLAPWNRLSNARLLTLLWWSYITTSDQWQEQCLCTDGNHEGWRILFVACSLTGSRTLVTFGWDLRVYASRKSSCVVSLLQSLLRHTACTVVVAYL